MPDFLRNEGAINLDRSDPLSPERFRELELTVDSACHAFEIVARVAKDVRREPTYLELRHRLQVAEEEVNDELGRLGTLKPILVRARTLTEKLDMSRHENIDAYSKADQAVVMIDAGIASLGRLLGRVHACKAR